mmetsp:Transcript_94557/g.271192  ORF Transcript_94557/g.271192 Transcript_94557/m.271192 type:complete len:352 (+) Transcript_94557:3-1058(+)
MPPMFTRDASNLRLGSIATDFREAHDSNHSAEEVEGEVCEDTKEVVLEAIVPIGIHLCNRILHPVEKQGMRRLDVVSCLGLLHSQPEEGPLVVTHKAEPRTRMGVVELTAAEVGRDPAAAIHTNSPKVVGCELLLAMDNGRDAVQVQVLEAHGFAHVQPRAIRKVDTPRIHQLLPLLTGGIHRWVRIEVLDVIERLHVEPEVHVSEDRRGNGGNAERDGGEGIPHLVAPLLLGRHREEARGAGRHQTQDDEEPSEDGLLVVQGEGHAREDTAEDKPRHEDVRADGDQVDSPALARRENAAGGTSLHAASAQGCRGAIARLHRILARVATFAERGVRSGKCRRASTSPGGPA